MTATTEQQTAHRAIEYWATEKLIPYARNPRKNDAVVNRMASSIREFGFKVPILARSSGDVVDGHLRLKAAILLGITELPVILCDEWSAAQVKAFRLMVNRSVQWAQWDDALLGVELQELKAEDFNLDLTGFDLQEMDLLLNGPQFAAVSFETQGKLDQLKNVTCPNCKHEFRP